MTPEQAVLATYDRAMLRGVGLGAQVPMTPTPMTSAQALGALAAAGCPPGALTMVAAQSAVETNGWGHGGGTTGQGFNNYNFGNVTATSAQIAAGASWMAQGKTMLQFLAFSDAVSGAKAMLAWLQGRGLLAFAADGDLSGYMSLLQAKCYLGCVGRTAPNGHVVSQQDYDSYRAGIASWMSRLRSVAPAPPPGPVVPSPAPAPSTVAYWVAGIGIVALGTWGYFEARRWRLRRHLAAG